jgi:hypothetical protein
MLTRLLALAACTTLVASSAAQSLADVVGPREAGQQAIVRGVLDGSRTAVFDTAKDSCELIDIPDAPARAFRDYLGTVHLVASHYVLRQNIGPSLDAVKHDCRVDFNSAHDPFPADFNDATWLDSFYSLDGKSVVALGHMEYHGWEHLGMCRSPDDSACWYNADTFLLSDDGGYRFASFKAPANFVIGLPYRYEVDEGPEGYSVDTNIVKDGRWYYAMATDWPWPPGCYTTGTSTCVVPFGGSPIRTSNILDVTSWRGWNGKTYSVSFVDPYLKPVEDPSAHVYTPVPYMYYVNAINILEPSHLFVATLWDPFNTAYGPRGLYLSTSTNLVDWQPPTLVVTQAQLRAREPKGNWSYAYFSLLDPRSGDANFSTIGDHPDLYYVRLDNNHPPYVRVLFRQGIDLTLR